MNTSLLLLKESSVYSYCFLQATSITGDGRKRALLAVVSREQHYATCLQFGLVRFVSPLADRLDLIINSEHQLLFQNIEEVC